jgi:hypothetical protein
MLLLLFENDLVLAKVLPIGTAFNNTTTVAIAKANSVHVLSLFAMLLTYGFGSP